MTVYDADFTEVKEEKQTTSLSTIKIDDYRHPLLKGLERAHVEKGIEELNLDEELGLKRQAQFTAKTVLQSDIDELTKSNDYYEVNKKTIEKIFGVASLRAICLFHNIIEAIRGTFDTLKYGILVSAVMVGILLITVSVWNHAQPKPMMVLLALALAAASFGSFIGAIVVIFKNVEDGFDYDFMAVKVDSRPLRDSDIKIPYGAKLKIKKAKDTKIFEDFVIVHPEFNLEHKHFQPSFKVDPAVLGVTRDNRTFMIVYWDIEKDREKVIRNIQSYKKFKHYD